ncbi:MAG: chemotaxis protein CheW [Bacillota bacterium]
MFEMQLVIFKLGQEEYGVEIMQVQEIGEYRQPIKVPNSPAFIEGIINLRGDVIPVISMHTRFNIPKKEVDELTRLIVINVGERKVGFIVDDASEVLTLSADNIEEPPTMIAGSDRKYIAGVGKIGDRILIILDLNKLFTDEEQEQLASIEE